MQRIYIEYRVGSDLANAYSVKLSSSDEAYGVKKQDGTIVVADNTEVTNSSTGIYEYNLAIENNTTYIATWEIVSTEGDEPIYTSQTIGPFSVSTPVQAVSEIRGKFAQGTTSTLFLTLTDIHGNPLTADSITLSISLAGTAIISSVNPVFIKSGFYAWDWSVASDITPGDYLVTWAYSASGFSGIELQTIVVSAAGDQSNSIIHLYGNALADMRTALTEMLACAQRIPVYREQAIPDPSNTKFKFTFNRWNQAFGTRIYRNQKQIEEGLEINYFKGLVTFDEPLTSYDTVYADYNFRWFSDSQLDRFLENAVFIINLYPPATRYNLLTFPDMYIPIVLYGAAKDAIREMLMCLQFQQPQQVFGGTEAAQKAFSNLETLKKNYEEEVTRLLEQKKFGPYPRTKAIVTPEFTLPGGRSRWFRYMFGGGS